MAAAASVFADRSRVDILTALADGRALPAGELARAAGVSASTASAHLSRLQDFGLLVTEKHGRHRYYRLASEQVSDVTELLAQFAPRRPIRSLRGSRVATQLALARTCYDHLAGELGVSMLASLRSQRIVEVEAGAVRVRRNNVGLLDDLAIDVSFLDRGRRPTARLCLDWSARRHHLAGALGAALTSRIIELKWLQRAEGTRALSVTEAGWDGLQRYFGIRRAEQHCNILD